MATLAARANELVACAPFTAAVLAPMMMVVMSPAKLAANALLTEVKAWLLTWTLKFPIFQTF